ncbi:hypothetical protein BC941DRAFT_497805 [Chlamydoabsidia padenii]|nr:hypothetical protein BC941DRAFT_497805 [Chlamydoabsidia padenii]
MTLKHLLITTLLLALVLTVVAAPLQDISATSVELAESKRNDAKGNNEQLLVTVTRVDDLVDDDGSVLAERVMAVQVSFDVVGNQLHCNGVPIELGVSNIQVEAQVASNANKLTIESDQDLAVLQDSFDVGLATVEVSATLLDELVDEQGVSFRRIAVQEKITEINHEKVIQTNGGQQLLDIFDNGRVDRWAVDPITGFLLPQNSPTSHHLPQAKQQQDEQRIEEELLAPWMGNNNNNNNNSDNDECVNLFDPVMQWWNSQSNMVQGMIAGALCTIFFAAALFVRHLLLSVNSAYEVLPLYEDDQDSKDTDENDNTPPIYEQDVGSSINGVNEKQPFLTR